MRPKDQPKDDAPVSVQLDALDYWKLKGLQANLMSAQRDAEARVRAADAAVRHHMAEIQEKVGVDLSGSWDTNDSDFTLVRVS